MTQATKEQLKSIVRHIISAVAMYLIAAGIGDADLWMELAGAIGGIISTGWSVWVKTTQSTRIEALARHALMFVGGYLTFISPEVYQAIVGSIVMALSTILAQADKVSTTEPEVPVS